MEAILEAIDILAELDFGEEEEERLPTLDEIDYDEIGVPTFLPPVFPAKDSLR